MTVLYEPKGAAREYASLAANLYKGCNHGCTYCYAPNATFRNREVFHNEVVPRNNVLMKLDKDIVRLTKKGIEKDPVLLSFTCDPYQSIEEEHCLTQRAIKILNANGFPVRILTKAGELAQRDFDLLAKNRLNEFGVSLTFTDDNKSLEWEPNAALPQQRINNLKAAKEKGISTWVSIEPIVIPEQSLELIDQTHEFVDFYGVGKLNYNKIAELINWEEVKKRIIKKLKKYKKNYTLHESLKKI
jgi:DNA repair photolyase